jgi:prepilin-type N-terminal cleavage/methylation domain-containing protein
MGVVRDAHGVTLFELMVALAVSTSLAGIALFSYRQAAEDLRLNQAARQVVLDLTITRTRALAENGARRVVFSTDNGCYQPQRQAGGSYEDDGAPIALPAGIELTDCTASGSAVTFRPRGNATSFGTITLRNPPGRERHVVVDIAGRIRVE